MSTWRVLLLAGLSGMLCLAAGVAGRWDITARSENGQEIKAYLTLRADGDRIAGTIGTEEGDVPLSDVQFSDPDLSFKIDTENATYTVKAKVNGDLMKGTYTSSSPGASGAFTAVRAAESSGSGSAKAQQ